MSSAVPASVVAWFQWWRGAVNGNFQRKFWTALFFSCVWTVWLHRNEIIFKEATCSEEVVRRCIFLRVSSWMTAIVPSFPYSGNILVQNAMAIKIWSNPTKSISSLSWSAPVKGTLKWNTDGSSLGKPGASGVGGVLRDHGGNFICCFSRAVGTMDSNEAELRAIAYALELSVNSAVMLKGITSVIIESDSKTVISWIRNEASGPWRYNNLLNQIVIYLHLLPPISFIHVLRGANSVADILAK